MKKTRPASGKGSRQPILKLPAVMRNGARTTKHPLLYLMDQYLAADPEAHNKSIIAAAMSVRPQSLYKWERACRADRNFPLPVLRAKQLAGFFNVPPATFRPDFPWDTK